jgi:hypothetical protein
MQSLRRTPYEDGFPEPEDRGARAPGGGGVRGAGDDLAGAGEELAARYTLPRRVVA